jgi:hypothetical protein
VSTRRRTWLVLGVAVTLVAEFAGYLLHQVSMGRAAAIESAIKNGPLTISVSGSGLGSSWDLDVDTFGNGIWKNHFPTQRSRRFVVSKGQFAALRKAMQREHFFYLADTYGEPILDTSSTTIQIWAGDLTKTVTLHHFGNGSREKLPEPSRARRVLQAILTWCNDPKIGEFRESNERFIDGAK